MASHPSQAGPSGPPQTPSKRKRAVTKQVSKPSAENPQWFLPPETFNFYERILTLPKNVQRKILCDKALPTPPDEGTQEEWDAWYAPLQGFRTDEVVGSEEGEASPAVPPQSAKRGRPRTTGRSAKQIYTENQTKSKSDKMRVVWSSAKLAVSSLMIRNPYTKQLIRFPKSFQRYRSLPSIEPSDVCRANSFYSVDSWTSIPETFVNCAVSKNGTLQSVLGEKDMIFLEPNHDPHLPFPAHYYETLRQRFRPLSDAEIWPTGGFRTRGHLCPHPGYEAWASRIVEQHEETLKQVGLLRAIQATSSHFHREPCVYKGFLNHWSSITNSFHLPYGEMSISLWDLYRIAGLPIRGRIYDEWTPSDEELSKKKRGVDEGFYSEACYELFAELPQFLSSRDKVPFEDWLIYFSHGLK